MFRDEVTMSLWAREGFRIKSRPPDGEPHNIERAPQDIRALRSSIVLV